MRRTKIVCTLGPASEGQEPIEALVSAGMDVARLNFSHSNHDWHAERLRMIRSLAQDRDRPLAVLQDLPGPKIRIGEIPGGGVELKEGEPNRFTPRPTELAGASRVAAINLPGHGSLLRLGRCLP